MKKFGPREGRRERLKLTQVAGAQNRMVKPADSQPAQRWKLGTDLTSMIAFYLWMPERNQFSVTNSRKQRWHRNAGSWFSLKVGPEGPLKLGPLDPLLL